MMYKKAEASFWTVEEVDLSKVMTQVVSMQEIVYVAECCFYLLGYERLGEAQQR